MAWEAYRRHCHELAAATGVVTEMEQRVHLQNLTTDATTKITAPVKHLDCCRYGMVATGCVDGSTPMVWYGKVTTRCVLCCAVSYVGVRYCRIDSWWHHALTERRRRAEQSREPSQAHA